MTKEEAIKVLSESIHEGSKVPWDKIVEAVHLSIEALSQPSLPSNLDEAAMEIVIKMHPCMKDCQILGERITRGELIALVKAGVEWLAGQGETLNSLIWRDEDDKLFIEAFVDENKFKMAENVTIQVRKKK